MQISLNKLEENLFNWFRTKWKRQTAVGLELLAEAGNFAAVQRMLQTNPYWATYAAAQFGSPFLPLPAAFTGTSMAGISPPNLARPVPFLAMPTNCANISANPTPSDESPKSANSAEATSPTAAKEDWGSKNFLHVNCRSRWPVKFHFFLSFLMALLSFVYFFSCAKLYHNMCMQYIFGPGETHPKTHSPPLVWLGMANTYLDSHKIARICQFVALLSHS